ncbi:NAD-dependent epimerase/dehydratase family protein [Vibrio mimicus]
MYFMFSENRNSAVILVGKGLVGDSIYTNLIQQGYYLEESHRLDWSKTECIKLISAFISHKISIIDRECQLTILWSAGKLGFSATNDEIVSEQNVFMNLCQSLSRLNFVEKVKPRFVLFSSIGGLFEGQSAISDCSSPNPLRPYGFLKLYQEETAQRVMTNFHVIVLRLSSVYGPIRKNLRMGLIQVLILNGLQRSNSMIFGTLDTLRDYVFVDDIARFTVELVGRHYFEGKVFHLVSGKPSSILQIQYIVERLICRPLLLSFSKEKQNALDIPCVKNSYAGLWLPSSLEVNIKKIYVEWLSHND